MDELKILTRQEPGIAELYNFDEIKAYLDQRLEVYRNLVYSEDGLKSAKADKAALNKLKRALDTRRKEIKAIYMEPYLRIEAQIKELTAMIDEPLQAIDGFVKGMEAEEKTTEARTDPLVVSWRGQSIGRSGGTGVRGAGIRRVKVAEQDLQACRVAARRA